MVLPSAAGSSISARIKVLSNLKLDEKRLPQDGRFKVDMNGEKVSFRVSILPTYYGEKLVMRLLRESISGFTLEFLHFHGESWSASIKALNQTTGMILTTGPTGSGKTTSLYTMLDILNQPDVNISTIEDPIEYQMARINQTNVRPEIGFSFAQGIRTLVRQDPDIIMVGEIRDNETAALAVNAALTGHLGALDSAYQQRRRRHPAPSRHEGRVIPFGLDSRHRHRPAPGAELTESKTAYALSKDEFAKLAKIVDLDAVLAALKAEKIVKADEEWENIKFWKANPSGDDDGFKGRVGIHEVLKMSPAIKDLIMKDATSGEIEDQAKKEGMLTMIEDGVFKCVQGMTTIEEVLRVVSE
jgi:type IV pilus assembly protein PilB